MNLMTSHLADILLFIIIIEITVLLAVRLFIEVLGLIKTRPMSPMELLAHIPTLTDEGGIGQHTMGEGETNYSVEERIWAREQGAKTETEEDALLANTKEL